MENLIAWLTANGAVITAVVLVAVRIIESIMVVLPQNIKGVLATIIKVVKEFFKLS